MPAPITAWAVKDRGVISAFYVSDSPRNTMARWLAMKGKATNDNNSDEQVQAKFEQLAAQYHDTGLIQVNISAVE
jgi:hypothetical protein